MPIKTIRSKPVAALPLESLLGSAGVDRRLEVLRAVGQTGSISQAARSTGVSYKAGWQAIDTLSNLAGVPLVEKLVGGAGGGGARLTRQGLELLHAADQLRAVQQQALAKLRAGAGRRTAMGSALAAVGLRTSMRNQMPCEVHSLSASRGSVRVKLSLSGGQSLTARVTDESVQLLGLEPGLSVLALCKATAVTVAPHIVASPDVNVLTGELTRSVRGGAGEVYLQLSPGLSWVGFADPQVKLRRGQRVMAAVEESALVIGLMT